MKILKTDVENLEEEIVLLYKLTKGSSTSASKLSDEELDATYPVDAFVLYEDVNRKGEDVKILAILSGDRVITAQSETFQRSFFDIVDIVKNHSFSIKVTDGKTKSDRRFMNCELAAIA